MNINVAPQTPLLDLDLLKTLVAIAETGNFSAAAEVVFRSPSAISMQVKKMEDLLGRAVFTRDSRSVALTSDGEMLLLHARRVLALNQQIVSQFIKPSVSGTVRLGASDYATEAFLPAALRRFAQTHPGVTVDVLVERSKTLESLILSGKLDIAILDRSTVAAQSQNSEILFRERLVWAGLKGGIAVEKKPIPISVWEDGCFWRQCAVEGLESQDRAFHITFMSPNTSAQKAAILADLAIAPLPESSCTGDVIELGQQHGLPPLVDFAVGMMIANNVSPPVCAVADHLRATLIPDYKG